MDCVAAKFHEEPGVFKLMVCIQPSTEYSFYAPWKIQPIETTESLSYFLTSKQVVLSGRDVMQCTDRWLETKANYQEKQCRPKGPPGHRRDEGVPLLR